MLNKMLLWCFSIFMASVSVAVPTLRLTVPENSKISTPYAQYRYGGVTESENLVTFNGETIRVYPTGGFAGLVALSPGVNIWEFVATNKQYESTTVVITINRTISDELDLSTTLRILGSTVEPSQDIWLGAGEILNLSLRGSPSAQVKAFIGSDEVLLHQQPSVPDAKVARYNGLYQIPTVLKNQNLKVRYEMTLGDDTVREVSPGNVSYDSENYPTVAVITESSANIYASLGTARLGGALLCMLPESTRLVLDGKIGNMYRIRLTKDLHAWTHESNLSVIPGAALPNATIGGATLESSTTGYDQIFIGTPERLPYLVEASGLDNKMKVHIFGAASNLTWITNRTPLKVIRSIDWKQVADGHLVLDITLDRPPVWGYDATYPASSNGLRVIVKHPPVLSTHKKYPLQGLTIALDAGHGGRSSGALGATRLLEKDCNLDIVLQLKSFLEHKGANIVLTRGDDSDIDMNTRRQIAIDSSAKMLVSIHNNSTGEISDPLLWKGSLTLYRHDIDRPLSEAIQTRMSKIPNLYNGGLVSSFNFSLVKHTDMPEVLVECAYMSNPEDEMLLSISSGRGEIAKAIGEGIIDHVLKYR